MRDGWRETTLGEVATLHYGKALPADERVAGGVPVAGSSGQFGEHDQPNVTTPQSIVVGRKGTAGSVTWFDEPAWVTDTAYWAEPRDGVGLRYLRLLLEGADLPSQTAQTGVPGLNRDRAYAIPVLRAPLDEQRRIVDLIAAVDDAVDAAEAEADGARNTEASVTAEHFAAIEHTELLGSLVTARLGKMLSKAENQGEDAPYLRNVNVRWGSIDTSDLKTMPFTEADHAEFALRAGDVLVCEGGEIARAAVLDEDLPGIYFQKAIHRVRCGPSLRPHYLQRFLAHAAQSDLLADYVSGSTIKHLTGEKLAKVPVPHADLEDQDLLITRTEALRVSADAADATAASLRALRSNLLTVLLSGEHEIPSSYDALLEEVA